MGSSWAAGVFAVATTWTGLGWKNVRALENGDGVKVSINPFERVVLAGSCLWVVEIRVPVAGNCLPSAKLGHLFAKFCFVFLTTPVRHVAKACRCSGVASKRCSTSKLIGSADRAWSLSRLKGGNRGYGGCGSAV